MRKRIWVLAASLFVLSIGAALPAFAEGEEGCPAEACTSTNYCHQLSGWCTICDRKPDGSVCR